MLEQLCQTVSHDKNIEFVFASACHSENAGRAFAKAGYYQFNSSFSLQFLIFIKLEKKFKNVKMYNNINFHF